MKRKQTEEDGAEEEEEKRKRKDLNSHSHGLLFEDTWFPAVNEEFT